jgi:hypothetical protein
MSRSRRIIEELAEPFQERESCCHRRPFLLCVAVDKPLHAGLSGCRGSANDHVTVPLRVAMSAIARLQQLLDVVDTKFSLEARATR